MNLTPISWRTVRRHADQLEALAEIRESVSANRAAITELTARVMALEALVDTPAPAKPPKDKKNA